MYISHSKISSFISCPLKYQMQYIEHMPGEEFSSSSAELGKYIHEVLENYREGLDINEIAKLYESKYTIADSEKEVIPSLLEMAEKFYDPYRGLPFESEQKFFYEIPHTGGEPVTVNGIIDKLYFFLNGEIHIIDWKTGKVKSDNRLQMKFYAYLLNKCRNIDPKLIKCKVFYLRLRQPVSYEFDIDELNEFETWIQTMVEMITNTKKFKHNFSGLCKWCQYKNTDCVPNKTRMELYGKHL